MNARMGRECSIFWLDTYQVSRSFEKPGMLEVELP
jgi:hypothetical protein